MAKRRRRRRSLRGLKSPGRKLQPGDCGRTKQGVLYCKLANGKVKFRKG